MLSSLEIQISSLSEETGVYHFFDKNAVLLYVGKAKNLKKRVTSYFQKRPTDNRTQQLVRQIYRIETILVRTETDALLLENNLIKNHQPKYNILLKDDKTYPWICIKKEAFPRVFITRKKIIDGSEYFGPYPSVKRAKAIMGLIKKLYPIRTCDYDLSAEKRLKKKYKVCLDFHIGNCKGACENKETETEYKEKLTAILQILRGHFSHGIRLLKKEMLAFSEKQAFEQAQEIKEKLTLLSNYQEKSTVVSPKLKEADVVGMVSDEKKAYFHFFKVSNGCIIKGKNMMIKKRMGESDEYLLTRAIVDLRSSGTSNALYIFVALPIENHIENIKIIIPKTGNKKHLVDLATYNAKHFKTKSITLEENHPKNKNVVTDISEEIKKTLGLKNKATHIECFDNSNLQGTMPVAACVVFKNGRPSKKDYRKFHIKSVIGADDFASMREVVFRRYERLLKEGKDLPQLVVIDGGKGQLSAALNSLKKLHLAEKIMVIGIAKKLELIYFPNDPSPLFLPHSSKTLKIIQQLRDEAHRFGLSFHRKLRGKNTLKNELENIKGIGEKTATVLLSKYGSTNCIKNTKHSEICKMIGKVKAEKIKKYFDAN